MVTTAYLQKVQTVKCRPNLYDDPERRIVVIIRLQWLRAARGYTMYEFIKGIVLGYIKRDIATVRVQ